MEGGGGGGMKLDIVSLFVAATVFGSVGIVELCSCCWWSLICSLAVRCCLYEAKKARLDGMELSEQRNERGLKIGGGVLTKYKILFGGYSRYTRTIYGFFFLFVGIGTIVRPCYKSRSVPRFLIY